MSPTYLWIEIMEDVRLSEALNGYSDDGYACAGKRSPELYRTDSERGAADHTWIGKKARRSPIEEI